MIIQFAQDIIEARIFDYLIAGSHGILIGIGFGIEILIIIDLLNNKNSYILTTLRRYQKCATENTKAN